MTTAKTTNMTNDGRETTRVHVQRYSGQGTLVRAKSYRSTPARAGEIEAAWVARQTPGAFAFAQFDDESWVVDEDGAREETGGAP